MENLNDKRPERGLLISPKAAPAVAYLAVTGIIAPATAAFLSTAVGSFLLSAVISVAVSALTGALTKKPKPPASSNFTRQLRDRTITARQPIAPRRIIYGDVRVGGVYTFIHTTGSSNEFINLVITISGHEIEAFDTLYFDGVEIPLDGSGDATGDFAGFVHAEFNLGTETQTAFAGLVAAAPTKWTSAHRQLGCAGAYVQLKYDADKFPNGIPGITFQVRGKADVFDPRTSTTGYSNNAALCLADYLAFPRLGLEAVYSTEILDADLIEAANICDEVIPIADPGPELVENGTFDDATGWTLDAGASISDGKLVVNVSTAVNIAQQTLETEIIAGESYEFSIEVLTSDLEPLVVFIGGGVEQFPTTVGTHTVTVVATTTSKVFKIISFNTGFVGTLDNVSVGALFENRYECNGTLETDATPFENIKTLTGAMAGAAITQGKLWSLRAGAYRAPEIDALTEGDFVGAIDTQTLISRTQSFNGVKGVFTSPLNSWQPDDFPAIQVAAYVTEDNGQEVWSEVTLPFTTSVTAAQRISRQMLELTRRQITVTVPCKMIAYQLQPFDTVKLTIARYGWTDKTFKVQKMQLVLGKAWSVRLDLQEVDAAAYAWSTTDEGVYTADPTTTLPGTFTATSPGLTVSDTVLATPTGGAVTNLIATVQPASDAFASEFEVEFKLSTDSEWSTMGRSSNTIFQTANVVDGKIYDVRARSISVVGVKSEWGPDDSGRQHTIVGQTALPPDVTGFSISIIDGAANLSWNPVEVVDLSHYRIKYSGELSGATWASSTLLIDRVGKPATSVSAPALVGTYLIKAVDFGPSGDGSDGRESEDAALIVSNVASLRTFNQITTVEDAPGFAGVKTQTIVDGVFLELDYQEDIFTRSDWFGVSDFFLGTSGFYSEGWYEFENIIDLLAIYTSRITASIAVSGENYNEDVFARPDFFDVADFFNVDASQYGVELQISTTDDPGASPVVWADWQPFVTGDYSARGLKFRVYMTSTEFGVTPIVSALGVTVDMASETRADEDFVVTAAGLTVLFAPAFWSLKGVAISGQGLATGDYYTITNKDETGFDIAWFNSSDVAIQRTTDYVAVGFGRVI